MKINKLHLNAFGPFTDTTLDFSCEGYGLHLVLGANEAGKSSALRALTGLLYGFGHRVSDAWLHANKDLSVAGEFLLQDTRHLSLTRYKRRKNDLIDNATGNPFGHAELDAILGRMGREAFRHTFGISHDSLRLGVESVLAAGGDLGQALFAATSGLNTLKNVMVHLEQEQGQLFSPRGTKTRINAALSKIQRLRKQQSEASASHRQWKLLKKKVDELQHQEITADREVNTLSTEFNLLSRHRDALPHVTKWQEVQKELDTLETIPDLGEEFPHTRFETQVGLDQARQSLKSIQENLKIIDTKLKHLILDKNLLAHEKLIENLSAEANVHTKAKGDAKSLRSRIYHQQEAAQKALSLLHSDMKLESIESLRLSKPEHSKLQRLGAKGIKLQVAVNSVNKSLRTAHAHLEQHKTTLSELEIPAQRDTLAASLARAAEHGKLHEALQIAKTEANQLHHQAETDLAALGLWKGSLNKLQGLPIPSSVTMHRFDSELSDLAHSLKDVMEKIHSLSEKQKEMEKNLGEMTRLKDLPTLEILKAHRTLRDSYWQSLKTEWLQEDEAATNEVHHFPDTMNLASAFEQSINKADATSDALREDAEAIAHAETLKRNILDLLGEKADKETQQKHLLATQKKRLKEWASCWEPLGIIPLSPREMIAWAERVTILKTHVNAFEKAESLVRQLDETLHAVRSDICTSLISINIEIPEATSFVSLIDLARQTLAELDALHEKRKNIERRIIALNEETQTLQEQQNEFELNLNNWQRNWNRTVAPFGFGPNSEIEDVQEFILAIEDTCQQLDKVKELQTRNEAIESDHISFTKRVSEALEKLAPELKHMAAETAAFTLVARLAKERNMLKEYQQLEIEKQKLESALTAAAAQLASMDKIMNLLCEQAGTEDPKKLPDIEIHYRQKSKLLQESEKIKERLSELAAGLELPTFINQVKSYNPDELIARLDQLITQKKRLLEEQKRMVAELALARKDLESFSSETEALELAEKAEGLIGRTQTDVEQYIKLRLAAAILKQSIERYRKSNQSPVLDAAGEYFRIITRESFVGLQADYDGTGDPVIKAKRGNGSLLSVGELSDGSRDQLFLSLRLGGLARYISNNGPMPFVVDDVLVHFDDERSLAALEALNRLARQTQIIFFTHHHHLLELINKNAPGITIHVHHLLPKRIN